MLLLSSLAPKVSSGQKLCAAHKLAGISLSFLRLNLTVLHVPISLFS